MAHAFNSQSAGSTERAAVEGSCSNHGGLEAAREGRSRGRGVGRPFQSHPQPQPLPLAIRLRPNSASGRAILRVRESFERRF